MTDIIETVLESHGNEVLVHYGVPGMRWGHRKEYITSIRTSHKRRVVTRRENRAKGHDVKAVEAQKIINQIKSKPQSNRFIQYDRKHRIKNLEEIRDTHKKAASDIRSGHLTDYQKHVLIGTGITAGIIAAYGTYKFADSGHAHAFRTKDIPFKKNDALSRTMSSEGIMKNIVKQVNPGFGERGTVVNCRRCTFAYEMRRRGFDVRSTRTFRASGQTSRGLGKAIKEKFKTDVDPKLLETDSAKWISEVRATGLGKNKIDLSSGESKAIFSSLKTQPNGARGELGSIWKMGGAHSMAWEVINGTPHIFDTQTGEHYTEETFSKIASSMSAASFTRLDNIELNTGFVKRWVTNV